MEFEISDDAADLAAALIVRRLDSAVRRAGAANLALSGGSTAPAMIAAMLAHDVPWRAVTAWQVDERVAPDGDPARNVNQLSDLPCRVVPMPVTAPDLGAAAARYAAGLPERFDVVHLGVGDDGHTASWPPGDMEVVRSPGAVALVPEFNGWRRMTLTPHPINAASTRVVLATGAAKRPMIERWLAGDRTLPVANIRRTNTIVVVDGAAAPASHAVDQ